MNFEFYMVNFIKISITKIISHIYTGKFNMVVKGSNPAGDEFEDGVRQGQVIYPKGTLHKRNLLSLDRKKS